MLNLQSLLRVNILISHSIIKILIKNVCVTKLFQIKLSPSVLRNNFETSSLPYKLDKSSIIIVPKHLNVSFLALKIAFSRTMFGATLIQIWFFLTDYRSLQTSVLGYRRDVYQKSSLRFDLRLTTPGYYGKGFVWGHYVVLLTYIQYSR